MVDRFGRGRRSAGRWWWSSPRRQSPSACPSGEWSWSGRRPAAKSLPRWRWWRSDRSPVHLRPLLRCFCCSQLTTFTFHLAFHRTLSPSPVQCSPVFCGRVGNRCSSSSCCLFFNITKCFAFTSLHSHLLLQKCLCHSPRPQSFTCCGGWVAEWVVQWVVGPGGWFAVGCQPRSLFFWGRLLITYLCDDCLFGVASAKCNK